MFKTRITATIEISHHGTTTPEQAMMFLADIARYPAVGYIEVTDLKSTYTFPGDPLPEPVEIEDPRFKVAMPRVLKDHPQKEPPKVL